MRNAKLRIVLSFCYGYQNFCEFKAIAVNAVELVLIYIIAFVKKFKPIFGLTALFESNIHFCVEIRFALCSYGFTHICSDACAAFQNLNCNGINLMVFSQIFVKIYCSQCKSLAFFDNDIFSDIIRIPLNNYALHIMNCELTSPWRCFAVRLSSPQLRVCHRAFYLCRGRFRPLPCLLKSKRSEAR